MDDSKLRNFLTQKEIIRIGKATQFGKFNRQQLIKYLINNKKRSQLKVNDKYFFIFRTGTAAFVTITKLDKKNYRHSYRWPKGDYYADDCLNGKLD